MPSLRTRRDRTVGSSVQRKIIHMRCTHDRVASVAILHLQKLSAYIHRAVTVRCCFIRYSVCLCGDRSSWPDYSGNLIIRTRRKMQAKARNSGKKILWFTPNERWENGSDTYRIKRYCQKKPCSSSPSCRAKKNWQQLARAPIVCTLLQAEPRLSWKRMKVEKSKLQSGLETLTATASYDIAS